MDWFLPQKTSSLERMVAAWLDTKSVSYQQWTKLHGFYPDFWVPMANLAIEVDGSYWHSLPAAKARDAAEARILKMKGIRLVRIGEAELRSAGDVAIAAALEDILYV
jgi:very-short-patch-repair endonuclease